MQSPRKLISFVSLLSTCPYRRPSNGQIIDSIRSDFALDKRECYTRSMQSSSLGEDETPLVNTGLLAQYLSTYRVPLLFMLGSVFMVSAAFLLYIRIAGTSSAVVFEQSATGSATVASVVQVDVEGSVEHPGVYTLSSDSRVADALTAAGGLSLHADREWVKKNMNRAARLTDGGKIYIMAIGENPSSGPQSVKSPVNAPTSMLLGITTGLVNINTANDKELDQLPGVGTVTAAKIVAGRPYQSVEELQTRKILGKAVFEKVKNLITAP
jgi:competence protein ComEA